MFAPLNQRIQPVSVTSCQRGLDLRDGEFRGIEFPPGIIPCEGNVTGVVVREIKVAQLREGVLGDVATPNA